MAKSRISINDIAEQLNISKTTVSFIINGKAKEKRISDALVARVQEIIETLGYSPNPMAQSLRTGKTNIIGLMVEDISNPFFAGIAKHIEDKAYKGGYKIIYCSTENNDVRAKEFLTMFSNLGVDGYIITPSPDMEGEVRALLAQGANVILFDRHFGEDAMDYVIADNEQGTYEGTRHLIEQGYRNIGFVTIASKQSQMMLRMAGYKRALKEAKLKTHIFRLPFYMDIDQYPEAICRALKSHIQSLDAILFSTNYLGVRGLEALVKMGIKIREDIGVLCFDDNDFFKIFSPTISVIGQPMEAMADSIIETLLQRLKSDTPAQGTAHISLPTRLIIRESTQPLAVKKKRDLNSV